MIPEPLAGARLRCTLPLPVLCAPDLVDLVAAHAERVDMRVMLRWQNERVLALIRDLPDVLAAARERRLGADHQAMLRHALIADCEARMARQDIVTLSDYVNFQVRYDLGAIQILSQESARLLAGWRSCRARGEGLSPDDMIAASSPVVRQWAAIIQRLAVLPPAEDDARDGLRVFVQALLELPGDPDASGRLREFFLGAEPAMSDAAPVVLLGSPMKWACISR